MGGRGANSISAGKITKSNSVEIGNGKFNIVSNLHKDIPNIIEALAEAYNSGQRDKKGSKYLTVYVEGAKSGAGAGVIIRRKGRSKAATFGRIMRGGVIEGNYKTINGVARATILSLISRGEV